MDKMERALVENPMGGSMTAAAATLMFDKFRALVKQREGVDLSMEDVVMVYEVLLEELMVNSKRIITELTVIAGERAGLEVLRRHIIGCIRQPPEDNNRTLL